MNDFAPVHLLKSALPYILLATGASVDNAAIGVSLGISKLSFSLFLNGTVGACNALGTLVSSHCGAYMKGLSPEFTLGIAGVIFFYLGAREIRSWYTSRQSPLLRVVPKRLLVYLAATTTLNNLACGFAGGAAGLDPMNLSASVLVVSVILMSLGHMLGNKLGRASKVDSRLISGGIFVLLACFSFLEILDWGAAAPQ